MVSQTGSHQSKALELKKETEQFAAQAGSLVLQKINNETERIEANSFLVQIKEQLNKVATTKAFFVKPLKEHVKNVEALFKPQETTLEGLFANVKRLISNYLVEEDRKARVEEDKKAKIRDAANAKREDKGLAPIETPVNSVERPQATAHAEGGRSSARKVWKAEVIDARQALVCNEQITARVIDLAIEKGLVDMVVRKMVADGARELKGVRIFEDFDISATAFRR